MDDILRLAPRFTIFSPNLLELQTILSIQPSKPVELNHAEEAARRLHDLLRARDIQTMPAIIVRAGELGAYTLSDSWTGWTPAYWTVDQQDQVVDPTGGGNGFMGGLMAGMLLSGDNLRAATVYASVGASYIIQQRGLPKFDLTSEGERWNKDDPWRRVNALAARMESQQ